MNELPIILTPRPLLSKAFPFIHPPYTIFFPPLSHRYIYLCNRMRNVAVGAVHIPYALTTSRRTSRGNNLNTWLMKY